MKILLVGLGSIGSRHVRNLKELMGSRVSISALRSGYGMDISGDTDKCIDSNLYSLDELECSYDAIFITNPTCLHYKTLTDLNGHSEFFFIEKPVFMTGEESIDKFVACGHTYYVACPLRYSYVIEYLKNRIDMKRVHSVRCIFSSYLPDWRPYKDYRQIYSAKKNMGGGVALDLIHEWDYLIHLIGEYPQITKSIIKKKSQLEIDSEDIALYISEFKSCLAEIHLDYFGRIPVRKLELYTDYDTIEGDIINQKITYLRGGYCMESGSTRNEYQMKEIAHFIDIMEGAVENNNPLEMACRIERIARGIE